MKKHAILIFLAIMLLACAARAADTVVARDGTVLTPRLEKTLPMDFGYLYDMDVPLEQTVDLEKETDLYKKYRVTYVSVNDMTVPALLVVPKGDGPFPVLIFMNGKGGNKNDILPYADRLASEGFAVFAADPQYHGERRRAHRRINDRHLFIMVRAIRQTVLDYRRGIDFLLSRPEIKKDGILYLGGSMGGIIGAVLCGVETRINACVLTVAGGPWTDMARKNPLDEDAADMDAFRKENNLSWDDIQKILDPVDPINYIGLIAPRPVLMLNGKNDILVPVRSTKKLFEAANEPKEIRWLNYSHLLPYDELIPDILAWARDKLGL
jgi:fermentation-respiration switch protein FrsA (DUF1100 family)